MALEIALRSSLFSPRLLQAGGGEPPKAHWVGNKEPVTQNQGQGTSHNNNTPKKKDARGYRDLSTITLGEVDEAYQFFASQLVTSPYPSWVAPNYFCMIHLVEKDDHPPAVFGRVKTCYPSDGHVQNIHEMELLFPRKDDKPDMILLRARDIHFVDSYCLRVKFLMTDEEAAEFGGSEGLFAQQGFLPEFSARYIELLEAHEQDQMSVPWIHVISSRWFASISETFQPETRELLTKLIHWKKSVFNYHPEGLPHEIRSLNRELGFKDGISSFHFYEPETAPQILHMIAKAFDEIFGVD